MTQPGSLPISSEPRSVSKTLDCPVVGIGASAGGLEALKIFFRNVPTASGLIFVIVQHLSPDHPSHLPELLSTYTAIPVRVATDQMDIEVDHIYVIPPDCLLTIHDCELHVSPAGTERVRAPIDHFLRSLAEDQRESAVGVILSGAGSDGAIGLQAIKKHGGLALVQSPETAKHDGMPRAAIATGTVDHALPLEELPAKLITFFEYRAQILKVEGPQSQGNDVLSHLGRISSLLEARLGHDFSRYKQSTLVRRIQRRMQLQRIKLASDYVEFLDTDSIEVELLFKDLLISVTQFFRDRDAWEVLARRIVPKLFHTSNGDSAGPVRVWVPGCATGQEAYSIAILIREHQDRTGMHCPVQVFATDIDEEALETARLGQYSDEVGDQIARDRLARFFIRQNGTLQVTKEIREMCIFSMHNLVTDPPFSRMDLVSCRNVLIYFEAALQQKVIPIFHYALRQGGFLFLGPAESLGEHQDFFRPVDKRLRLFQAKENLVRVAVRLPRADGGRSNRIVMDSSLKLRVARERDAREVHERVLLERFAPPSVLIDAEGEILHYVKNTERYLVPPTGSPTQNLFDLIRDDLRVALRAALHEARNSGKEASRENVEVEASREIQHISLVVQPIRDSGDHVDRFAIVFQEIGVPQPKDQVDGSARGSSVIKGDTEAVQHLERELRSTKECLQATIEELENSNEELKSSNEELISLNEEYQSANESLQTSKEELQSLNEELETLNSELSKKLEELDRANVDMQHLFAATKIATIFLNRDLRVQRFTPAATELFNLIDSDIGRPLLDITTRFSLDPVRKTIEEIGSLQTPRELEIAVPDQDRWFLCRILPYRTSEMVCDGVVITFVDITSNKKSEARLRLALEENRSLHEIGLAFSAEFDLEILIQKITDAATIATKAQFGAFFYNTVDDQGESYMLYSLSGVPREAFARFPMPRNTEVFGPTFRGEAPIRCDDIRKDPRYGKNAPHHGMPAGHLPVVSYLAVPVVARSGEVIGGLFFGHGEPGIFDEHAEKLAVGVAAQAGVALDCARMVDSLRRSACDLAKSDRQFRQLADAMPQMVWATRADGYVDYYNERWYEFTGFERGSTGDTSWTPLLHPDDKEPCRETWYDAVERGVAYEMRYRFWDRRDNRYRWFLGRGLPVRDETGDIVRWFGTCTDIDDIVRADEALREAARRKDEFLAMLGHELRNPLAPLRNGLRILDLPDTAEETTREVKEMLHRQVKHLSSIVDELLDVSRISTGKISLKLDILDFAALTRSAAEDFALSLENQQITFNFVVPEGPVYVRGDRTRLCQSLSNLLHNACKFTDEGGHVTLLLETLDDRVAVAVRDTGIGMTKDLVARLFQPFSQGEATLDRSRGGLGLGLAVVRGLIELHQGRVSAESDGPGLGSTFTIELPTTTSPKTESASSQPASAARCRIVLIEDNPDAARTLSHLLRARGHEVSTAMNGRDGVESVRASKAEVLICDIGLPGGMDGYDVARALEGEPGIRPGLMIALSGYGQQQDQQLAREAGFDVHLTKPVDVEVLETVINEARS